MGKLTGLALQYAAEHMTRCRKHGYKKCRVLIECDGNDTGMKLAGLLEGVYNDAYIADYSGGYIDFSLVFPNTSRRDEVVTEINSAVTAYLESHQEIWNPDYEPEEPEETTPPAPTTDTESGKNEQTNQLYTYIIIGALVILAILLLWPGKRK